MKRWILCLSLGLLPLQPALAAPGDMLVSTFLTKADALKAKGLAAMFSSDVKLLQSEGQAAGVAYFNRLKTERTAGRPSSCPPKDLKVDSNAVIAHMRSYAPDARGRTNLRTAMADFFIKSYPCRR
jgi:hypothetical protein